jgi:cellulose synthase/poly-beta-1,6-N-acetylglucosamine synthase-like glycosyltransferase
MESVRTYPGHNLMIIELPVNKQGKKEALVEGVRQSHSELLLFTDADCRVQSQWIKTIVRYYCKYSSNCLIGMVDYQYKPGILRNFWHVDLISLVVSGAGTASLGSATLCNGANLAIKKSAYNKVTDQIKMHITSGDDIFILHALKKLKESVITVVKNRNAIVCTNPPETTSDFFNQRIRWASKGLNYNDVSTILLALIVFLTNLILIVTFLLTLTGVIGWILLLILFTLKLTADCLIIAAGLKFFQNMKLLFLIPFYELFYPFYALFTSILGISRPYSWKGR